MCHESFYFCFLSEWVSQEALPTVILGNENSIWKCWKAWPKILLTDGSHRCSMTSAVSFLKSRLKAFPNWSAPAPVRLTWQFSCRSVFTIIQSWCVEIGPQCLQKLQKVFATYVFGCRDVDFPFYKLMWIYWVWVWGIVACWQVFSNKSDQYEHPGYHWTKTKLHSILKRALFLDFNIGSVDRVQIDLFVKQHV